MRGERRGRRRHDPKDARAMALYRLDHVVGRTMRVGLEQRNARSGRERDHDLPDRLIEADRRRLQHAIAIARSKEALHRRDVVGERSMLDHHALRRAGRAGRVDHVGEIARPRGRGRVARRLRRDLLPIAVQTQPPRRARQSGKQPGARQQQRRTRVLQKVCKPLRRITRIERHVDAARLQDCQEPHDELE